MEVNKVNSWDDVVTDNYNQPAAQAQEETKETVEAQEGAETTEETTDAAEEGTQQEEGQQVQETQIETQSQEETVEDEHQEEVVKETIQERVSFEELDEDELYELLTLKKTDYNQISDIDIVAGLISSEHENWSDEDIQFELEQKYGSALFEEKINLDEIDKDIDPDGYKEAVKHNKEVDRAQKLLRRDALEVRAELEQYKANIQLPTSKGKPVDDNVKEEKAEEVETDFEGPSPEEVAEHNRRWAELVESEVPNVKEFTFKLEDEDVSYKVTEEEQAQMVQRMKDFNAELYFANRGWVKPDGSLDVKKITEDVYILENSEKMFKSGWTQAKEKAKMDIISKDIKNINLSSPEKTFDAKGGDKYDFGNFVLGL